MRPTIRCSCTEDSLVKTFEYDEPPEIETKYNLGKQRYERSYFVCDCGHWFAKHNIDLKNLYDAEYVRASYGDSATLVQKLNVISALPLAKSDNKNRIIFVNQWFETFSKQINDNKSVLDVGGGLGVFLRGMIERGWHGSAIELDPMLVAHLKNNLCIEVHEGDLRSLTPKLVGSFDLITFNKVLEHIIDPGASYSLSFLKKKGVVYFEVPDNKAAKESKGREKFTIEHLHVFSMASAIKIAEKSGFCILN